MRHDIIGEKKEHSSLIVYSLVLVWLKYVNDLLASTKNLPRKKSSTAFDDCFFVSSILLNPSSGSHEFTKRSKGLSKAQHTSVSFDCHAILASARHRSNVDGPRSVSVDLHDERKRQCQQASKRQRPK